MGLKDFQIAPPWVHNLYLVISPVNVLVETKCKGTFSISKSKDIDDRFEPSGMNHDIIKS